MSDVCNRCTKRAESPPVRRAVDELLEEADIQPEGADIRECIRNAASKIKSVTADANQRHGNIKVFVSMGVDLHRAVDAGVQQTTAGFRTAPVLYQDFDLEETANDLVGQLDHFNEQGSSWTVFCIRDFKVHTAPYHPLDGKSYFQLPVFIRNKKAVLNIKSDDLLCFVWSVIAHLFPVTHGSHANRVKKYEKHFRALNVNGIEFPMTIHQIPKFELLNSAISINVYTWGKEKDIIPLYVSKCIAHEHQIDLLLAQQTDKDGNTKRHFTLIKDMSRLVAHRTRHEHTTYVCRYCVRPFSK